MTLHVGLKTNAFRILGLDTSVLLPAVIERANELGAYLGINQVPPYPNDFPTFAAPERTPETVAAAVHRLEDPLMRLRDEATWFHRLDPVDASATAALADGNLAQAKALWEGAVAQATDAVTRLHYQHNLAVLYLCAAGVPAKTLSSPLEPWERALTAWTPLLTSETFWGQLVAESPAGRDARCQPGAPHEVRAAIGHALAHECRRRAAEALGSRRVEEAWAWAAALTRNRFPAEFAAPAVEELLEAVAHFIRTHLEPAQAALREAEEHPPEVPHIESRLRFAQATFEQFQPLGSKTSSALQATADLLAETYRSLALYYVNQANNASRGLELVETAARLAASEGLRVHLQQAARILHWNIAFDDFKAAVQENDYARAQAAFEVLEQYKDPAQGPEALDPLREALRNLRILRGCQPITKAPSLYTINGIGTRLHGRSDEDPVTGTYLTTLFFTVLFIPLIPLGRYRVQNVGGGQYQFYGKVPLTQGHWAWIATVAVAGLVGLFAVAAQEAPRSSRPPRATFPAPRTEPAPPSVNRSALRVEIERRRPILKAEQGALAAEGQSIDREQAALDDLREEIEARRTLYPGGLPPNEYARDQQAVADYNSRLQALKVRLDAYNARIDATRQAIAEFNALVNQYNASR